MAICDHVLRRRGVYYWRRRLPRDLAARLGRTHLSKTLRTHGPIRARLLARRVSAAADQLFAMVRRLEDLSRAELETLLDKHLTRILKVEEHDRATAGRIPLQAVVERSEAARDEHHAVSMRLATNDLSDAIADAEALLRAEGLEFERSSQRFADVVRGVLQRSSQALAIEQKRHVGDYSAEPIRIVMAIDGPASSPDVPPGRAGSPRPVSELFKEFEAEKSREDWDPNTRDQAIRAITLEEGSLGRRRDRETNDSRAVGIHAAADRGVRE